MFCALIAPGLRDAAWAYAGQRRGQNQFPSIHRTLHTQDLEKYIWNFSVQIHRKYNKKKIKRRMRTKKRLSYGGPDPKKKYNGPPHEVPIVQKAPGALSIQKSTQLCSQHLPSPDPLSSFCVSHSLHSFLFFLRPFHSFTATLYHSFLPNSFISSRTVCPLPFPPR